jgi:hypothetical protein
VYRRLIRPLLTTRYSEDYYLGWGLGDRGANLGLVLASRPRSVAAVTQAKNREIQPWYSRSKRQPSRTGQELSI